MFSVRKVKEVGTVATQSQLEMSSALITSHIFTLVIISESIIFMSRRSMLLGVLRGKTLK